MVYSHWTRGLEYEWMIQLRGPSWMSFICHIHNYTEYNEEWNVFSAFNPSKCTHLEQWAADCAAPGEQSWTSCQSRDSNPQPWVTSGRVSSPTLYPLGQRLPSRYKTTAQRWPSSGEMRDLVIMGILSLAIECSSIAYSLLRCIVGLECTP